MFGTWMLRAVNLLLGAYVGGLVASYAVLFATPNALTSPTLAIYPLRFAAGILIFTLPGTVWVAAIFRKAQNRLSLARSYGVAVLCGALTGGTVLWALFQPTLLIFGIGGFFGLVTASVWAGLNRYLVRAF